MTGQVAGKCKKKECKADKNAKCLEGFDNLVECPNFELVSPEEEGGGKPKDTVEEIASPSKMIELPSGDDLSSETGSGITRASHTRVIVLAGAPDSGKTTLLATIYDCFQDGPFADYIFAGSQTLVGFERRCHLSRIASGRSKADTARTTPTSEPRFLHLRVTAANMNRPAQDLLLSDLSGETFLLARDSSDECKKLGIVSRADRLVLLLDGGKFSEANLRQSAFTDGASLLRSFLDADIIGGTSVVDVLITKWDLVKASKDEIVTKRFTRHVILEFKKRFKARIGELRFCCISARPEKRVLPFAYGIKRIFPRWVEKTDGKKGRPGYYSVRLGVSREFDRFIYRQLGIGVVED